MSNKERPSPGEVLAELIREKEYGEIIRRQEIENTIEAKYGSSTWMSAIARAKKLLLERKKMIVSMRTGGDYRVIEPGEYSEQYQRQMRLAEERVRAGASILRCSPIEKMSQDEKATHERLADYHKRIAARFAGDVVDVALAANRDHPFLQALQGNQ